MEVDIAIAICVAIYQKLNAVSQPISLRPLQLISSSKSFVIASGKNLGEIERIEIWQDDNVLGIKWFIQTVTITSTNQGHKR